MRHRVPSSRDRDYGMAGLLAVCLVAVVAAVLLPAGVAHAAPGPAAPAACGPSFSDRLVETPWPLRRLQPESVWPLTRGDGVTVAVIDSGVSATHPSLQGQVILPGRDYIQPGAAGDCDEVAHGTFVAGLIAGRPLPNSGFYGVAPGAKILPIRVLRDDQKSLDASLPATIADAVNFAVEKDAKVINLSLVTQPTPQLTAAINQALAKNIVVVAAAGNDGASQNRDQPAYPAALDGVIAVAGIDEAGKHVATSTSGSYVDVAAPGSRIEGPAPQGGGFGLRSGGGTSFAAAYVSGVAALVRAYHPSLTAQQVAARITSTADHPPEGRNDQVGFGMVNPYRAVAAIADPGGGGRESGGRVAPAVAVDDPLRSSRMAALWTALGGLAATALIWAGRAVLRGGRRRQWRAGRRAPVAAGPLPRIRDDFSPLVGTSMTVTGPTVHRSAGSRGLAAATRRGISMPSSTSGTDR